MCIRDRCSISFSFILGCDSSAFFNVLIAKSAVIFLSDVYKRQQQNQEIHKDVDWQDKMVEIEMQVPDTIFQYLSLIHI